MSLPDNLPEALAFLRDEIHHFPPSMQARVVSIAQKALSAGLVEKVLHELDESDSPKAMAESSWPDR